MWLIPKAATLCTWQPGKEMPTSCGCSSIKGPLTPESMSRLEGRGAFFCSAAAMTSQPLAARSLSSDLGNRLFQARGWLPPPSTTPLSASRSHSMRCILSARESCRRGIILTQIYILTYAKFEIMQILQNCLATISSWRASLIADCAYATDMALRRQLVSKSPVRVSTQRAMLLSYRRQNSQPWKAGAWLTVGSQTRG